MNLTHFPDRMQSTFVQYGPNKDIPITETSVEVQLGKETLQGQGKVFLVWHPSPRLAVRTDIEPDPVTAMSVFIGDITAHINVAGIAADWQVDGLSPLLAATTFQTAPPVASDLFEVQFHIVNFVDYIGTKTRFGESGIAPSRLTFSDDQWQIFLDSHESTREYVKVLRSTGGYALTHVGKLMRIDHSTFSSKEAQQFLKSFARLLAFVQGRWAPLAIILGFNSDHQQVWARWETIGNTEPWHYVDSWFNPIEAPGILPPIFAGYRKLIDRAEWQDVFSKVVYWYILANTIRNFEPDVIIAQASLELLAWTILLGEKGLSAHAFGKLPKADQLRLLLSFNQIPLEIPVGLTQLTRYARANNHLDGPGSLTLIRNRLVHPGKPVPTPKVVLESRQLALWYIELVLLRLLRYSGEYASRVLGPVRWAGQTEAVPWSADKR